VERPPGADGYGQSANDAQDRSNHNSRALHRHVAAPTLRTARFSSTAARESLRAIDAGYADRGRGCAATCVSMLTFFTPW